MNRETFGSYLKSARTARSLPLAEIARITKIPERSLTALESGNADGLPADVFVRGFVSSYARAVGLDAAEAVARYGEAARADRPSTPKVPSLAARLAPGITSALAADRSGAEPRREARPAAEEPDDGDRSVIPIRASAAARADASVERHASAPAHSSNLGDDEASAARYRVGLTFAVIVLVIIATLTLSFLLRRPSQEGDIVSPVSSITPAAASQGPARGLAGLTPRG